MSNILHATIRRVVVSAWMETPLNIMIFGHTSLASALVFGPTFSPGASRLFLAFSSLPVRRGIYLPTAGRAIFWQQEEYAGVKHVINHVRGMGAVRFSSVACLLTPVLALAPATWLFCRFLTRIYGWRANGRRHVDGRGIYTRRGQLSALSQTGGLTGPNYWRQA